MPRSKYQVIKATTKNQNSITLGSKQMEFGRGGAFIVDDKGLADEIKREHGTGQGDVVVVPYDDKTTNEPGHNYRFGYNSRYAHAYERIFGSG